MMALDAHAWDGSDGRGVGPHKCSVPPNETSSLSKGTFEFRPRKKGCDGKFGSMQTQDRCGVCGGFDDCLGCDGQPNSGAVIGKYIKIPLRPRSPLQVQALVVKSSLR